MNTGQFKAGLRRRKAFTLIELLVLLATAIVVAAVFLPIFVRGRTPMRQNCVNNLKQVGLAFFIFAGDNEGKFPMQVSATSGGVLELIPQVSASAIFRTITNELGSTKLVLCPEDRERQIASDFGPGFTNRNVSYFVGLDAQQGASQLVLAGDRNLTANRKPAGPGLALLSTNQTLTWSSKPHQGKGNLGFADGSVQQVNSAKLQEYFSKTGLATNRLAMP